MLREGGKLDPFNLSYPPIEPYVPRRLTFEIRERIDSEGKVVVPLDEQQARETLRRVAERRVEAIAVCLLWSPANPAHEAALGRLIEAELPGVPYTLSSRLNPIIREYRRASSAAIDASLKPLMQRHLRDMEEDLRRAGFTGQLLVATSFGGVMHAGDVVQRPIFLVKSGPAMAPVAGRTYGEAEVGPRDLIVCDAGGTSFDVSLVHDRTITFTRETWLGSIFTGHITGHGVGRREKYRRRRRLDRLDRPRRIAARRPPERAAPSPGPACYGTGGIEPTVTDAALVLGYLDPDYFLGGRMRLDVRRGREGGGENRLAPWPGREGRGARDHGSCGRPHGRRDQGHHDQPGNRSAREPAGRGRRRGRTEYRADRARTRMPPGPGAAHGRRAQRLRRPVLRHRERVHAEQVRLYRRLSLRSGQPRAGGNHGARWSGLEAELRGRGLTRFKSDYFVEARYPYQVWELEVALPKGRFEGPGRSRAMIEAFHREHERVFAVKEPGQQVECVYWRGRLTALARRSAATQEAHGASAKPRRGCSARPSLPAVGERDTPRYHRQRSQRPGWRSKGPRLSTSRPPPIVVYPGKPCDASHELHNYLLEVS